MKITRRQEDDKLVLVLNGELGHHEAIQAMSQIKGEVESCMSAKVVLDMDGLGFMDSSGIAVVLKAYKAATQLEIGFCVKAENYQVKRILYAAGVQRLVEFI